jgi:hypothetical protein
MTLQDVDFEPYRNSCWQQLELSAPLDAAAIGGQQGATEI